MAGLKIRQNSAAIRRWLCESSWNPTQEVSPASDCGPEAVLLQASENILQFHTDATMTPNVKQICCWYAAALMLIVSLYPLMGVLQAGSIYATQRVYHSSFVQLPVVETVAK
jgi:hypothetical protein